MDLFISANYIVTWIQTRFPWICILNNLINSWKYLIVDQLNKICDLFISSKDQLIMKMPDFYYNQYFWEFVI